MTLQRKVVLNQYIGEKIGELHMRKRIFQKDQGRLTCVVLCAGEGTRILRDAREDERIAKALVKIQGKPLISHVIEYWKDYADEFIFVVKFQKEKIIEYVSNLPIKSSFIEQKELRGIANALSLTENLVSEQFIMVLGDCIIKGEFDFPRNLQTGVGIWHTSNEEDIKRSYSVELQGDKILRVVEKPKTLVNDICGMGFYFFNKRVFEYIRQTPPSALRGEIEITDTLQKIIDGGEKLSPVSFRGSYFNITYREDLKRVEEIFNVEIK